MPFAYSYCFGFLPIYKKEEELVGPLTIAREEVFALSRKMVKRPRGISSVMREQTHLMAECF